MKNILITGGSGSLGSEICKQLLDDLTIDKIIIFSRGEQKQLELKWKNDSDIFLKYGSSKNIKNKIKYIIGDVKDYNSVYNATIGVDEVYHLAAMKHIDIAEENPIEATNINVVGTINVINACIQNKVKKLLFISTDKASSPTGIYGTTKLLAEKNVLLSNKVTDTKMSVVRFGNLIGSSGSIFKKWSCSDSKIINITDKNVTRFFIKITDAATKSIYLMNTLNGNEIFIPRMKSAHIYKIAKAMANDKTIEIVGLRSNEKLHEDIISITDFGTVYENNDFYTINPNGTQNNFTYNSINNLQWFTEKDIEKFI